MLWKVTIALAKEKEQPSPELPWCEAQNIVTPCSGFPWLNTSTTEKPTGF